MDGLRQSAPTGEYCPVNDRGSLVRLRIEMVRRRIFYWVTLVCRSPNSDRPFLNTNVFVETVAPPRGATQTFAAGAGTVADLVRFFGRQRG